MANGNGTNGNYDNSPLSRHVRPTLAWAGFLVYTIILFMVVPPLIDDKAWGYLGILLGSLIGMCYWYFGVRGQQKSLDMLTTGIKNGVVAGLQQIINPSPSPAPLPGPTPAPLPGPQPQPGRDNGGQGPAPTPVPEAFNEAVFDAQVEEAARGVYGVVNQATKFYEAWELGAIRHGNPPVAKFDWTDPAWVAYLRKLINLYFSSIWGLKDDAGNLLSSGSLEYAIIHLNDEKGCTTCGGRGTECPWTSIQQKADFLATPAGGYSMALKNYHMVELYASGQYFVA